MTLATINQVLFAGLEAADFSGVGGTSTDPAYWRTGTVAAAFQGPLTIPLPRKVAYPEILSITASVFVPASPTTGWQGQQIFSLTDGGANKLGLHMFGGSVTNGNSWHYWNASNQKTNLFGSTTDVFGGLASLTGDLRLTQGSLCRRTWSIRYDAVNTTSPANQMVMAGLKAGWSTGSTSAPASGISTLGASTGIDGIVLGSLNGAWWSEIVVTAENAFPTVYSAGGFTLYAIPDTRPDLVHPYGIITQNGNPGESLKGYAGVVDGYTWAWQLQDTASPYVLVYAQEVEAEAEPPAPDPVTGTAETALADLTGTGAGAVAAAPAPVNTFTQRITLIGTMRPTKALNATWVPK